MATQFWVNREYRRGLSTHPCGALVLRISGVEVCGVEVQDTVAQGGVQTQGHTCNTSHDECVSECSLISVEILMLVMSQ